MEKIENKKKDQLTLEEEGTIAKLKSGRKTYWKEVIEDEEFTKEDAEKNLTKEITMIEKAEKDGYKKFIMTIDGDILTVWISKDGENYDKLFKQPKGGNTVKVKIKALILEGKTDEEIKKLVALKEGPESEKEYEEEFDNAYYKIKLMKDDELARTLDIPGELATLILLVIDEIPQKDLNSYKKDYVERMIK